ncbi:MAG: hypothetical protein NVS1B7_0650 [Candidatus Saccharimonadales bacterium]
MAAAQRQTMLTVAAADQVDQFIAAKINTVILHSQTSSIQQFQLVAAQRELAAYIYQDTDLTRVALADVAGQEVMAVTQSGTANQLRNVSNSDGFRAASFLAGKEYISGVRFDQDNQPLITIAVPLVAFETRQSLANLSTAERGLIRNNGDIKGVLIADISLKNLWQSVLSAKLGKNGYAYVVDAQGKLIAHPDSALIKSTQDLSHTAQVAEFLQHPTATESPKINISEKGVTVLSAFHVVPHTGWAVIAEEPVSSIFAPVNHVFGLMVVILIISGIITVILSLLFSRRLTRPLSRLVAATAEISEGNLSTRLPVESSDEIGSLATRFNLMASNLQTLIANLKHEGTKLNIVLNSVGEGVVATDNNDHIILANIAAAVLAGGLPSDVSGKKFTDVFSLIKNNHPFSVDCTSSEVYNDIVYVSPNKRLHYLSISVNQIEDDPDGIKNIITLRDQTDERELELMKLDFVSMAAHELRTPITAIRGYLSLLSEDDQSVLSMGSKKFIERALSSTSQLVGLISNLLNVSKIERGTLNMVYAKIDWPTIVQDAIHDHEFSAMEKNIELRYEGTKNNVPLLADQVSIKEVINNLIANAIHYTDPGGHIIVSLEVTDTEIITKIKDDGIGIPANAVQRLFTKFYRVKGGIASGSGGTGLGLYISKSIVELHKGKIWVESEYGRGSTFIFSLPVYDEVQYIETTEKQMTGVNKRRGWVTKNITR